MKSPTQQTLKRLRELGYVAEVTERYNHHTKRKNDLYGFIDVLAVHPVSGQTLAVQTTSDLHGGNSGARIRKILDECEQNLRMVLKANWIVEVHGWRKLIVTPESKAKKPPKKPLKGRKVWRVKVMSISVAADGSLHVSEPV